MPWFDQEQQRPAYPSLVSISGPLASSPISGPMADMQPLMHIPPAPPTTYALPDERILPRSVAGPPAGVPPRTNVQHMMLQAAIGGNYLAPVEEPRYILDVGCGSGRWAYELAEQFPQARIVGVDLTPPLHTADISGVYGLTPPENLLFQKADVLEGLPFAASTFNFVHQRLLALAVPLQRWPHVMAELVRVTHPGGWVELVEADLVRNGGPMLERLQRWITSLAHQRGIDPHVGLRLGDLLHDAGLHRVVAHDFELPVGGHGGRFGELMAEDFLARVEQLRAMIVSSELATPHEYDRFLAALIAEMATYNYVQPFHVAYGRR